MNPKPIAAWVLQVLLGLFFLFAGGSKLAGGDETVKGFQEFGYGEGFLFFIGLTEALGGLALLFPALSVLAALGLMAIMVGAAYTHLNHGDSFGATLPAVVLFLLLGGVAFLRWNSLSHFIPGFKK